MAEFQSRHDIVEYIDERKRTGKFRDCAYLTYSGAVVFTPTCKQQAFHRFSSRQSNVDYVECPKNCRFFWDRTEAERHQAETLVQRERTQREADQLAQREREREERAATKRRRKALVWAILKWPFAQVVRLASWYTALPWQTQVLLALVLLLLLAPQYKDALIEVIKAVRGES